MSRSKIWSDDQLKDAVAQSTSLRQVIQRLGLVPAGGNYEQIKNACKNLQLDTSHLKGKAWNKGMTGIGKDVYSLKEILVKDSTFQSHKLKVRLFKEGTKKQACEECGWAKTSPDGRVPVELDHINGDRHDNRILNIRILCPNCHSLKATHRGLNKKK